MSSQRIDGATPFGGTYAIVTFYDDEMNETEKKFATQMIVCEYNESNEPLHETHLFRKKSN